MYIYEKITICSDEESRIETLRNEISQRSLRLHTLLSYMDGYEGDKYDVQYAIKVDASGDAPVFTCRFVGLDELKNRAAELESAIKEYRACLEKLEPLAASLEKRLNWKS